MFKREFQDRNKDRSRACGLRIGDIVKFENWGSELEVAEVIAYVSLNKGHLFIRNEKGDGTKLTSDECTLIIKVEDRSKEAMCEIFK